MVSNISVKVLEFRTDDNYIGESKIQIPASKMMEIEATRLTRDGWRLTMMDALSADFIIAVFERTEIEMETDG